MNHPFSLQFYYIVQNIISGRILGQIADSWPREKKKKPNVNRSHIYYTIFPTFFSDNKMKLALLLVSIFCWSWYHTTPLSCGSTNRQTSVNESPVCAYTGCFSGSIISGFPVKHQWKIVWKLILNGWHEMFILKVNCRYNWQPFEANKLQKKNISGM